MGMEERHCQVEGCGMSVPAGEGVICVSCGGLVCAHCPTAVTDMGHLCPECAEAVGIPLPKG